MAINLTLDTDPLQANGSTIFNTFEDLKAYITTTYGNSWTGQGTLTVTCQSSDGQPYVGGIVVDDFVPSETDNMIIRAVKVGNTPFRQTPPDNFTSSLIGIADDYVDVITELGTWFLDGSQGAINNHFFCHSSKAGVTEGIVLLGNGTTTGAALYAGSYARTYRKCIVKDFHRPFYGAFRDGSTVLNIDQCVFIDNVYGRSANTISNSILINTPIQTQYGIHSSSNNNAYTQSQTIDMYSDAVMGDANSVFDFVAVDHVAARADGGVNIIVGSPLATTASDGGPVGADALIITPATIATNITRGASFDIVLEGHTAGPSTEWVDVVIKDVAGDGTEYPCTVTTYTDILIQATAPDTGAIAAMSGAQVIVRYKSKLGYFE